MTALTTPLPALPLVIARILIGAVLFFYFLNTLRQARDFSDPDGLIDHRLTTRLLPPPGSASSSRACPASSSARST